MGHVLIGLIGAVMMYCMILIGCLLFIATSESSYEYLYELEWSPMDRIGMSASQLSAATDEMSTVSDQISTISTMMSRFTDKIGTILNKLNKAPEQKNASSNFEKETDQKFTCSDEIDAVTGQKSTLPNEIDTAVTGQRNKLSHEIGKINDHINTFSKAPNNAPDLSNRYTAKTNKNQGKTNTVSEEIDKIIQDMSKDSNKMDKASHLERTFSGKKNRLSVNISEVLPSAVGGVYGHKNKVPPEHKECQTDHRARSLSRVVTAGKTTQTRDYRKDYDKPKRTSSNDDDGVYRALVQIKNGQIRKRFNK